MKNEEKRKKQLLQPPALPPINFLLSSSTPSNSQNSGLRKSATVVAFSSSQGLVVKRPKLHPSRLPCIEVIYRSDHPTDALIGTDRPVLVGNGSRIGGLDWRDMEVDIVCSPSLVQLPLYAKVSSKEGLNIP
jgi:hypothetical protein